MAKRWPPTIGILGYDGGVRPAISLATNKGLQRQLSGEAFGGGGHIIFVYGACCYDNGDCAETTEATCGGHYQGDGSPCVPGLCDDGGTGTSGACCLGDNMCDITSPAGCVGEGGTYLGDDSSCDECPVVPTGACCQDPLADCAVTTEADCHGLWYESVSCDFVGSCEHAFCGPIGYYCVCPQIPPDPYTPVPICCPDTLPVCSTCFDPVGGDHVCCCCILDEGELRCAS